MSVYVCTIHGGFGRYIRSFYNSDNKEVIVYKWVLGYTTAFRKDTKILISCNEAEAVKMANEYWDSLGL